MSDKRRRIPSLVKWTGSKRSQAHIIHDYIPKYNRYYEPFLGGGAMLYLNAHERAIASDIYAPLIELWILVRDRLNTVVNHYNDNWNKLQHDLPNHFYRVRDRYNKTHDPLDLLFLTRTCVNGIIRFNKDGEFNNSFHLSRKGMHPHNFSIIANNWSDIIKEVEFICADYSEIFDKAKRGDFMYLDPPYAQSKNRYIINLDIKQFFSDLRRLNSKGVKYALSFDGKRDDIDLSYDVPNDIYLRKILINNGHSAIHKVLNDKKATVGESLYLNY